MFLAPFKSQSYSHTRLFSTELILLLIQRQLILFVVLLYRVYIFSCCIKHGISFIAIRIGRLKEYEMYKARLEYMILQVTVMVIWYPIFSHYLRLIQLVTSDRMCRSAFAITRGPWVEGKPYMKRKSQPFFTYSFTISGQNLPPSPLNIAMSGFNLPFLESPNKVVRCLAPTLISV